MDILINSLSIEDDHPFAVSLFIAVLKSQVSVVKILLSALQSSGKNKDNVSKISWASCFACCGRVNFNVEDLG